MATSSVVSVLVAAALHRLGRLVTVAADYRTPGADPSSWHRYSYTQFWEQGASTPKNLLHHPSNLPDGQLVDITLEQVLPSPKDKVPADLDGVPFYKAVSGTIQVDESSQEQSAPTFNQSKTQSQGTKADALFNQSKTQSQGTKVDIQSIDNLPLKAKEQKRHIQSIDKGQRQSQGTKVETQELGIQNLFAPFKASRTVSERPDRLWSFAHYTDVDPAFH